MGLASPTELIHEIYYRDLHRRAIAGLAALVNQAAVEGDAVAAQILARAGTELAAAASSVITRLGMRGDAFPTVLAGGIFRGVPSLARDVEDAPLGGRAAQHRPPAAGRARVRGRTACARRGAR